MTSVSADLCIVGTGPASLTLAAAAAQLGAGVVLITDGGHDRLPPGGLLAAATRSDSLDAALQRLRQAVAALAPNDSAARYRGLGVRLLPGPARFVAPDRLRAGDDEVAARRFVLSPNPRPPLPALTSLPDHLVVRGDGAFACEAAQAFARLGSRVTLVVAGRLLPREDPELAGFVLRALQAAGISLSDTQPADPGAVLLDATDLPTDFAALDLDRAGVRTQDGRPVLDRRLRCSNRRIFLAEDAADAAVVLKNALFRLPARRAPVPRVVFTDPEIAQVGLTEAEAQGPIQVLRWSLQDNERAQLQGTPAGLVKVIVGPRGRVLGAGLAGHRASELLLPWVLAVQGRLRLADLAGAAVPLPSLSETSKRAAASFFLPRLLTARTRRLIRLLRRLP